MIQGAKIVWCCCGIPPTTLAISKLGNSPDSDELRSGFTPLIWLATIRVPHALYVRRHTRANFAGSLDGFRLRRSYSASSLRTRFANGKVALRSLFHVNVFPVHRWRPLREFNTKWLTNYQYLLVFVNLR
jgi:hypothetical protein